jgi:hypothetical protein
VDEVFDIELFPVRRVDLAAALGADGAQILPTLLILAINSPVKSSFATVSLEV